jgi:hypothetical protein
VPATVNRGVPAIVAQKRCAYSQALAAFAGNLLGGEKAATSTKRTRALKLALGWR